MKFIFLPSLAVISISLLISACSGDSSVAVDDSTPLVSNPSTDQNPDVGDNTTGGEAPSNPDAAFGLLQRPVLSAFNLPVDGASTGSYKLVNAYPNLRFAEALLVDAVPGDNRMIVVEQAGRVKVFDNNPAVTDAKEILNIVPRVVFTSEQGLLGMAFDPNFVSNRYVYLYYTTTGPNRSVVMRMTWNASTDQIDPSSQRTILEVAQPYEGHNGGMIEFGPDGYLYIALGDGGDGGDPQKHGQNKNTLLASLLRIDVHPSDPNNPYGIPPGNPFVNDGNARDEIYAYGLRNPFRFSFDRQTGELWLGDVGQGLIEEINVINAGGNYGWRIYEGTNLSNQWDSTAPESSYIPPVFEYTHDKGTAVIGGYVYRGSTVGALYGKYLYTDFNSGTIWAITWDGSKVVSNEAIARAESPTSFGENHEGEVLVVSRYGGIFKFEEESSGAAIPGQLSQTGLFSDLGSLTPMGGLIEYTPSHPFWSDGVQKRRWIGVPNGRKISFTGEDWTFPVGTVAVKHFEINMTEGDNSSARRLETRVLYHTSQGWQGFTYRWNGNQTDAVLVTDRQSENLSIRLSTGGNRQQFYEYPSSSDCLQCHTRVEEFLLGVKTPQLNSTFNYSGTSDNQLRSWNNVNLFDQDIGDASRYSALPAVTDTSATVESRARAYLDVNCSQCHRPGGTTPASIDFRASASLASMNVVGINPGSGSLGITDAQIVVAGDKERSILWRRMQSLGAERMPPLSTHVVDAVGLKVVGDWIDAM